MAQSDWTEHGTLEHWTREGDHWTIENNMGTLIASNGAFAPLVAGDHPIVCQWDGTHGRTYAALGPYLLNVQLHSVKSHRLFRAQAPVYVCPP